MRPLLNRRQRARGQTPGALGRVKVDSSTKTLTKRLEPGDIAVIDHVDIDRVSAEALVRAKPAAVLNAARSCSGRYPNLGPGILVDGGIPLIDELGPAVMALKEGTEIRLDEATVLTLDETSIATGTIQTPDTVSANMESAREGLSEQIEAFASNTMDYVRRERELLLDGVGVPDIETDISGRHVLIVVRGYTYKEDLAMLRPYIREYRPLLIGVDGGADAVLEAGLKLDMIVGDMDSVSDRALTSGAEIIVHAYRDGRAPGQERVKQLGVGSVSFPATGTSEDVAMLLADDKGAELIVAVGTHETLVEFLDKGRSGMASTFLTRLRVGGKLIDAKGVSRLYEHRFSNAHMLVFVLAGVAALLAALTVTPVGQALFAVTLARLDDLWSWLRDLLPFL
ncbi:MAG: putative cytokinetic ring protein SteA [Beutenbergiaceae bacterium]